MATDPLPEIAMDYIIAASKEIEVQLALSGGTAPIVAMLRLARNEAVDAIVKLIDVDPNDSTTIQRLQNEAIRFRDLCGWLARIAHDGLQADLEVEDGEIAAMHRFIQPGQLRERSIFNEEPEGDDQDGPYSQ